MAPLTPFWAQPSHPEIQEVKPSSPTEFLTKSLSKVDLAPYAIFAKLDFPPCTVASEPTYATVQSGRDTHLNLNSDLVYINHSCEPSLIFDLTAKAIYAGATGLKRGQELTFFYPSTEWDMAQGFDCFCGADTCRGYISGAKNMGESALEGIWLNAHIRELLEEEKSKNSAQNAVNGEGLNSKYADLHNGAGTSQNGVKVKDATEEALKESLEQAKKMVETAQNALDIYKSLHGETGVGNGAVRQGGVGSRELSGEMGGDTRRGVTSRELSGEMGGDTLH